MTVKSGIASGQRYAWNMAKRHGLCGTDGAQHLRNSMRKIKSEHGCRSSATRAKPALLARSFTGRDRTVSGRGAMLDPATRIIREVFDEIKAAQAAEQSPGVGHNG